ncbi:hypothetical protein BDV19DRAFT_371037 [Aspergillus venezuelensis]
MFCVVVLRSALCLFLRASCRSSFCLFVSPCHFLASSSSCLLSLFQAHMIGLAGLGLEIPFPLLSFCFLRVSFLLLFCFLVCVLFLLSAFLLSLLGLSYLPTFHFLTLSLSSSQAHMVG